MSALFDKFLILIMPARLVKRDFGCLLYAFSRLSSASPTQNSLVRQIIEKTETRFSDSELSISLLAKELGYNTKYLSHLFKRSTGKGYAEYLQTVRIKFAVSLFDYGLDSVKNAALLSGFSDPFYFSTVFKKLVGVSPKEYKKEGQKTP